MSGASARSAPPGLRESAAQIVLFVQAFEEADRQGAILPMQARLTATRRAMRVTGVSEWRGKLFDAENMRNGETILRRSRLLFEGLVRKVRPMRGVLQIARLGSSTGPVVLIAALLAGLGSSLLDPARKASVLQLPVLALLAWNLIFYAGLVALTAAPLKRRTGRSGRGFSLTRNALSMPLAGLLLKWALWRRLHRSRLRGVETEEEIRIASKAFIRFGALWRRIAGPLLAARVRRMFHLGALALMLGAVGGFYLRGSVFEYPATWRVTFLRERQAQTLLNVILGPAGAILRTHVPEVAPLRTAESGDAVPWIRLYSVTALLFVILPRAGLALIEGWRCRCLADALQPDLRSDYFRRVFSEWRGAFRRVHILPHGFEPTAAELEGLEGLLHEFFGARAQVHVHPALLHGDATVLGQLFPDRSAGRWVRSEALLEPDEERERSYVVVFDLAQAPDVEIHARLLEGLKARIEARRERLLVLVFAGGYRDQVGDPSRLHDRAQTWERVVREAGLSLVALAPDRCNRENALAALGQALWPAEEPRAEVG